MVVFERILGTLHSHKRVGAFAAFFALCAVALALSSSLARAQDDDLFNFDDAAPAAAPADPAAAPAEPAAGGEAGVAAEDEGPKSQSYLAWMIRSLGWFFTIVFALISLWMVALVVMNIVALRRVSMTPDDLIEQFGALLDENKFQEAYELAKEDESLLGKVLSTGLATMPSGFDTASQAMADVAQRETMRLEHQLGYLGVIGNIAPMIGLFGTVVGMIASFQAIATGGAAPSPQKLAEGIATALFTTEVGLAIAIPSVVAYDILRNRLTRFVFDISVLSENFMGRFSAVEAPKE